MLSEQIPLPSPGRPHLVGLTRPLTHVPKKVVSGCSTGSSLLIFEHRFVILPRKERSGLSPAARARSPDPAGGVGRGGLSSYCPLDRSAGPAALVKLAALASSDFVGVAGPRSSRSMATASAGITTVVWPHATKTATSSPRPRYRRWGDRSVIGSRCLSPSQVTSARMARTSTKGSRRLMPLTSRPAERGRPRFRSRVRSVRG
jgi:hypothetical protein